jgi:hypothetical protein
VWQDAFQFGRWAKDAVLLLLRPKRLNLIKLSSGRLHGTGREFRAEVADLGRRVGALVNPAVAEWVGDRLAYLVAANGS